MEEYGSGQVQSGKFQERPIETILKEARLRHLPRCPAVMVSRRTSLDDLIRSLRESHQGAVMVVEEDGRLAGIFTERDYLDKVAAGLDQVAPGLDKVAQVGSAPARLAGGGDALVETLMTPSPRTLSPDDRLVDAVRLMTEGGYRHLPLVEGDGTVYGMVSAGDLVVFIAEHFPAEVYNLPPRLHQSIRTREGG